jgi:DNA-binding MarR family transcriptional regulator
MIREQELREFNINVERSSVLTAINNLGDKASPTTISHYLQRNCNTVTSILGKMEKEGLVEISPAGNTASRYVVRLSARGKAVSQKSIRISVVYDIIGRLTPEERTKFARYLERLRETAVNELAMNS